MAKLKVRTELRFMLNGEDVALADAGPDETLLDYLRLRRSLRGTKEGCAEGDCGACTVLVGKLSSGKLVYESVNACIRFLGSLDGCHVVTVEHLARRRRQAASGAAGDGRLPRLAMRLLHAGLRHVALCAVDAVARPIRRDASRRRCRAISAAAPVTRRSCAPPALFPATARQRRIRSLPNAAR